MTTITSNFTRVERESSYFNCEVERILGEKMHKALEILKNPMAIISANENHVYSKKQIYQVIAELEEAMKHKTCDGCVHEVGDMQDLHCAFCSRSCDDNFEPKDNA